jgi:hypothetical protein
MRRKVEMSNPWEDMLRDFVGNSPSPPAAPAATPAPVFKSEGPQLYQQAYQRNAQFAHPGPYHTPLQPEEEQKFRQWVTQNKVPFDPNAKIVDYDMRGFWKERQMDAAKWKPGQHFPDTYKTPYDTTFSAESKYAKPGTPFIWKGDNLIDKRTGAIVFSPTKGK